MQHNSHYSNSTTVMTDKQFGICVQITEKQEFAEYIICVHGVGQVEWYHIIFACNN